MQKLKLETHQKIKIMLIKILIPMERVEKVNLNL